MAIVKGALNPASAGTTTFPELDNIQVTAPNRHSVDASLLLDFANTKTLDPRITFTRGSSATYYDGTTALAEQNVVKYSQDFSNEVWVISGQNSVLTANSTTAPDGTATASTISNNSTSGTHRFYQSIPSFVGQTQYSFSVFLKYKDHQYVSVGLTDNSYYRSQIMVNLVAGTIVQNYIDASYSSGDTLTSTITSVGNSWYRVTGVYTPATAIVGNLYWLGILQQNSTFTSAGYVGTGTGFYMWGAQAEQRNAATAYTATTSSTISNYVPVLKTAGPNQARFDIDPLTLESKGLLLEEQRTNLHLYSQDLANSYWTASGQNLTVRADQGIAPDGTLTADLVIPTTGSSAKYLYATYTKTASVPVTVSLYAKKLGYDYITIQAADNGSGSGYQVGFNLSTGTVGTATLMGSATLQSTSITPVGNGWYRCVVTATSSGTTGWTALNVGANGGLTLTGDGFTGNLIWGVQVENNALIPTSYIPTVASTATRNFDYPVISGPNFSSWFNNTSGTVYVEATAALNAATGGTPFVYLVDSAQGPQNDLYIDNDSGNARFYAWDRGSAVVSMNLSTVTAGTSYKIAGAYKLNDYAASKNGNAVVTDTNATVPAGLSQMIIGRDIFNSLSLNSTIKKIAYYPIRLTNAELVSMTTA